MEPAPAGDEMHGYLMVHFVEDPEGYAEKIYFDVSRGDDPTVWVPLNDREPILASNLGDTGVRDPHLTYNPTTGTYYIIATDLRVFGGELDSWPDRVRLGSRDLVVWESTDLVAWGEPRLVTVAPPEAGMAWAPEATWVPELEQFVVYWSSTLWDASDPDRTGGSHSRVLWGTTSDFADVEYGGVMIDAGPGAGVIDTNVLQHDGTTYRISKDETGGRGIYMESTTASQWWTLDTSWTEIQTRIGADPYGAVEGPASFEVNGEDRWYLLVDDYPTPGYRPYVSDDLSQGWDIVDPTGDGFSITENTKHGGVLPLTYEQHERLRLADIDRVVERSVDVTTTVGTAPALPSAVPVADDGDTFESPVTWDDVPADAYAQVGTFAVTGTVMSLGNNLNDVVDGALVSTTAVDRTITATVTVTDGGGSVNRHGPPQRARRAVGLTGRGR